MKSWRIWQAGQEDADSLARLERVSFGARSWGENNLRESFVASSVTVLLGGASIGQPAGFAIWRDLGGEAELLTVGVDPAFRRAGLGAALITAVIDGVRAGKGKKLFLEVDAGNAGALALYRRFGFTEIGLRQGYYRDGADAVLLCLEV